MEQPREPDWSRALCRQPTHTHLTWFPPPTYRGFTVRRWYDRARAHCHGCPITGECLDYAMRLEENGEHRAGIWGGTTPTERNMLYPTWKGLRWLPRQRSVEPSERNSKLSLTSGCEDVSPSPNVTGPLLSSPELPDEKCSP